jgi:hypothetical protein
MPALAPSEGLQTNSSRLEAKKNSEMLCLSRNHSLLPLWAYNMDFWASNHYVYKSG